MRCAPKRLKIWLIAFVSSITLIIFINYWRDAYGKQFLEKDSHSKEDLSFFRNFNNETGALTFLIPNIVHYIIFQQNIIDFVTYLSIISAINIQRPNRVYIHCDNCSFYGLYWNKLKAVKCNTTITLSYLPQPTHVYGQPLSSVYHATDVARIQILRLQGGIYVDNDVIILKPLNMFRKFEMVVGWPYGQNLGTQILIAHKDARFLLLWLQSYQRYRPTDWYYNAGQKPTEKILVTSPNLVHRIPEYFGVHNLLSNLHSVTNWEDWRNYFALHLLSRHPPTPEVLSETIVQKLKTPFGNISRYVLNSHC